MTTQVASQAGYAALVQQGEQVAAQTVYVVLTSPVVSVSSQTTYLALFDESVPAPAPRRRQVLIGSF